MLIAELLPLLEQLAPQGLALNWDNVGLQVGKADWLADKVLLTLDVTTAVIEYAVKGNYNLIISHHPFIFKPISSVTRPDILTLIEHKIAVIAMHTNLDTVPEGVNTALAEILGLQVTGYLSQETGSTWYHGSVTVPPEFADRLAEAIHQAGAGRIGCYDHCSTRHAVTGSFRALEGSNPFIGEIGQVETGEETELEFMLDSFHLPAVKQAIAANHPYETPALYFFPVENANPAYGLGLICVLPQPLGLKDFASLVKERLQAPFVQLWTAGQDSNSLIRKVALCGGGGGSLISIATGKADVYLTGESHYHGILDSKIPLVLAGHFHTEQPVLAKLQTHLTGKVPTLDIFPTHLHEITNLRKI